MMSGGFSYMPRALWPDLFEEKKPMTEAEYQELLDAAAKVCEGLERLHTIGAKHDKRVAQANKVYQYIGSLTFEHQDKRENPDV